jgi:hypothetical protein
MMNKGYTRTSPYSSRPRGDSSDANGPVSSPESAFLACRERAAAARAWLVGGGVPLARFLVLSARDNPSLRSPDTIVSALPPSVRRLFLDDVAALLHAPEPSFEEILSFLGKVTALATPRGIQVTAHLARPGQPLTHFLFPIDEEGLLL